MYLCIYVNFTLFIQHLLYNTSSSFSISQNIRVYKVLLINVNKREYERKIKKKNNMISVTVVYSIPSGKPRIPFNHANPSISRTIGHN